MFLYPADPAVVPQSPIVGLKQELQDVRHYLADEGVGIIGICGMRGTGKTTLLKVLFQEFCREDGGFDAVILVNVDVEAENYRHGRRTRTDSGILEAQRGIFIALELPGKHFESRKSRAKRIHDALQGKRYLIMLDGIRHPVKMEKIGIPFPTNDNGLNKSSKLVVLSRSHDVCRDMMASRVVHVALLGGEAAWELFLMHAGEEATSQPAEIMRIAKDTVRECGGHPLSLVTAGLYFEKLRSSLEWKNLLDLAGSSAALQEDGAPGFALLESNFHGLSNARLRACFLYCSALLDVRRFISLVDLIDYWMEQGIFGDGGRAVTDSIRNEADGLVQQLEDAGLLMRRMRSSAASGVAMRVRVQRYALCKIKQGFLEEAGFRKTNIGASMLPFFEALFQTLRNDELRYFLLYFSLFPGDQRESISREQMFQYWMAEGFFGSAADREQVFCYGQQVFRGLHLQELLREGREPSEEVAIPEALHGFAVLRGQSYGFLGQAGCGLTLVPAAERWQGVERASFMHNHIKSSDVPSSIAAGLKALILRGNVRLKRISQDVFRSKSLRVLDLSSTGITDIPDAIGVMASLAHLNLSFTKITSLPKEVGELVNLRYLGLEGTILLQHMPSRFFSKLNNLEDLNMYDSFGDWAADGENSTQSGGRAGIEELEDLKKLTAIAITISNSDAYKQYMLSRRLAKFVRRLAIKNCNDLEISSEIDGVTDLTVCDCFDIERLVIGGEGDYLADCYTSALKVLRITGLYKARIACVDFRSLRELTIGFCHELTDLSWVVEASSIEHINLYSCRKLEIVLNFERSDGIFGALKTLHFRKLPSLTCICSYEAEFPVFRSLKVLECPQLRELPFGRLLQRGEAATKRKEIELTITGKKDWWDSLEWMDGRARSFFSNYFREE